jgi:hypothetical protein
MFALICEDSRLGVAPSSLTCPHRGGECPALANPCIERQVVERAHHHALGSEQHVVVEFEIPIIAFVPILVPIQFQAEVADHVEDSLCVEHVPSRRRLVGFCYERIFLIPGPKNRFFAPCRDRP